MKRIVFLVVVIILTFSLFGCANNLEAQVNELVEQKLQELEDQDDGEETADDNTSSSETNDEEDMDDVMRRDEGADVCPCCRQISHCATEVKIQNFYPDL